jgi:hypothetical protein
MHTLPVGTSFFARAPIPFPFYAAEDFLPVLRLRLAALAAHHGFALSISQMAHAHLQVEITRETVFDRSPLTSTCKV